MLNLDNFFWGFPVQIRVWIKGSTSWVSCHPAPKCFQVYTKNIETRILPLCSCQWKSSQCSCPPSTISIIDFQETSLVEQSSSTCFSLKPLHCTPVGFHVIESNLLLTAFTCSGQSLALKSLWLLEEKCCDFVLIELPTRFWKWSSSVHERMNWAKNWTPVRTCTQITAESFAESWLD